MKNNNLSKTNSGLKYKDDWDGICKFNDRLEKEIEKSDKFNIDENRFKKWKPKKDDDIESVKDKTAELTSLSNIKYIKNLEKVIYKNIMMKFNPIYFDTEFLSVNLYKNNDYYIIKLNIPNNRFRKKVLKRFNV